MLSTQQQDCFEQYLAAGDINEAGLATALGLEGVPPPHDAELKLWLAADIRMLQRDRADGATEAAKLLSIPLAKLVAINCTQIRNAKD